MPRGQVADAAPPHGGFGRMFPSLPACEVSEAAIEALVAWMGAPERPTVDNSSIPAGFTYLGQFIDHDITFDPTPLARRGDARAPVNIRTPRFDLDSVYGAGPVAQPFLYDWKDSRPPGARLLIGHNARYGTDDLPRNQQGRALIGDARNDEHVIVAQLHLLFIRFHNAVVDHLSRERVPDDELFERAQEIVRWHYQWIVVREFLPKVAGRRIADDVLSPADAGTAPTVDRRHFKWEREPFVPLEFSGAAYRFGHSMVRPEYGVKRLPRPAVGVLPIAIFPDLAGSGWLREPFVIDWERFFTLPEAARDPRQVQFSMRIDTSIAGPLFELPDGAGALPRLNLERGRRLELPSGQDVACAMHEQALTGEQLQLAALDGVDDRVLEELSCATPLWYYVLCEAAQEHDAEGPDSAGRHLGPVGGRIVAEVLAGLLEGDAGSFLNRRPAWEPGELGTSPTGSFGMADLVRFVLAVSG